TGSASSGGDLSCFPHGRMVPEFDDAVFALQPGQLSDLVKSAHGIHIIRLESKREETTQPLSLVKERIRQTLLSQKVRSLMDERVAGISELLRRGRSLD